MKLVRVLFIAAPFKYSFFIKMIKYFSKDVEPEIIVPSYPWSGRGPRSSVEKLVKIFLGDKEAVEIVKKFNPDVIYTDNPLYVNHSRLLRHLTKKKMPIILHLRGNIWMEFADWLMLSSPRRKILGLPPYLSSFLGVISADKITPICRWLESEVLSRLPWKDTEVVYQGVEPSDFFYETGFELARPAVSIIQNHTVYRKVLGLIKFRRVVRMLPDINFYITTGEGKDQVFLPLVRRTFTRFRNVHFIDNVKHPIGVRKVLSSSDIYVLASELDCCPTTILEASLMERPVLGSKIGGVPELIRDGYTGWSIRNENIHDWISKIRILVDDQKLSKRLGSQGRRWVTNNFSWRAISSHVENILKSKAN
jgi:glycosyltransferase involved in cell wall biosynthesis